MMWVNLFYCRGGLKEPVWMKVGVLEVNLISEQEQGPGWGPPSICRIQLIGFQAWRQISNISGERTLFGKQISRIGISNISDNYFPFETKYFLKYITHMEVFFSLLKKKRFSWWLGMELFVILLNFCKNDGHNTVGEHFSTRNWRRQRKQRKIDKNRYKGKSLQRTKLEKFDQEWRW